MRGSTLNVKIGPRTERVHVCPMSAMSIHHGIKLIFLPGCYFWCKSTNTTISLGVPGTAVARPWMNETNTFFVIQVGMGEVGDMAKTRIGLVPFSDSVNNFTMPTDISVKTVEDLVKRLIAIDHDGKFDD